MVTAEEIHSLLDFPGLIQKLKAAFCREAEIPPRHHHRLNSRQGRTLLLMPCWNRDLIGVKLVSVFEDNPSRDLPLINGVYLLMDGQTGQPVAIMDGAALTARRTAAASALASTFLSRPDSNTLLMVGAGALAPFLVEAHSAVRPIKNILLWNRHPARARELKRRLEVLPARAEVASDLKRAVALADIISCATPSRKPLIKGRWLKPGTHLDLVGGFTPAMRETDDEAVLRSCVFVDTRGGALKEAGDLVGPISRGILSSKAVAGDLFQLCRGSRNGRDTPEQITLFKSVGTALEDLAAAELIVDRIRQSDSRTT